MRNNSKRGRQTRPRAGGALLAVLWLCAALTAIAFSVANTVRGETERAATSIESLRAYYIASGAVERASLYLQWGSGFRNQDGTPRYWEPGMSRLLMTFPGGEAIVEVIPESSKLNINSARPEELLRLLLSLGTAPDRAQEITASIIDWRSMKPPGALGDFDQFYLSQGSSFRARHASFREIEELLFVKGMTPDIYYGSYARDPQGRLVPRGALRDCVSVYGGSTGFDIASVAPSLLASMGFSPEFIASLVEARSRGPIGRAQAAALIQQAGPNGGRLTFDMGAKVYTLRASARLRLQDGRVSDVRRSVAAVVRLNESAEDAVPFRVLRWYDNAFTDAWGQQ